MGERSLAWELAERRRDRRRAHYDDEEPDDDALTADEWARRSRARDGEPDWGEPDRSIHAGLGHAV